MRLISGYTDAAEQANWREQCEREARLKYDQAKKAIESKADTFRGVEDLVLEGISDMDSAGSTVNFIVTNCKHLADLYEELHKWRINMKNMGIEP